MRWTQGFPIPPSWPLPYIYLINITVKTPGRHHLNKIIKMNITYHDINWHHVPPNEMLWEEHSITSVVFLPKIQQKQWDQRKEWRNLVWVKKRTFTRELFCHAVFLYPQLGSMKNLPSWEQAFEQDGLVKKITHSRLWNVLMWKLISKNELWKTVSLLFLGANHPLSLSSKPSAQTYDSRTIGKWKTISEAYFQNSVPIVFAVLLRIILPKMILRITSSWFHC